MDPGNNLDATHVERVQFFVGMVGRFWHGFAADVNSKSDDVDLDYDAIPSGTMIVLACVVQIVDTVAVIG